MTELDLHFWVVKDGKIIDKSITNQFKRMLGDIGAEQLVYLPYPEEINDRIVEDEKQACIRKMAKNGKTWERGLEEGRNGENDNLFSCVASSYCYAHWNGGKVQVGCFGYIMKETGKIHWNYSHPDNPYDDYRRNPNDALVNDRDTDPAEHEGKLVFGDKLNTRNFDRIAELSRLYHHVPPTEPRPKKQKPNDKCACGSDKKYKKCCGKN